MLENEIYWFNPQGEEFYYHTLITTHPVFSHPLDILVGKGNFGREQQQL